MARNEQSTVNFNINITGANDVKTLTRELPKLIKQFDQLKKKQQEYESSTGGRGRGSGSGKNVPTSGDIGDRISGIKLGIRKGDISSVQQMHGHYGKLVQEINKMERAGKNVNNLRLRAYRLRQKTIKQIKQESQARQENAKFSQVQGNAFNQYQGQMISQQATMKQSLMSLKSANSQLTRSSNATKNASYLLLNTGYLIQDSPYGIRGMANNISQLAQSYQMLSQRITHLNTTQGKNLTVWGQLGNLMKGPTGIILLVGSVLPAALEMLSMHWDKLTSGMEVNKEQMERNLEILNKVIDARIRLTETLGADPLGIEELERSIKAREERLEIVEKYEKEQRKLHLAQTEYYSTSRDEAQKTMNEQQKVVDEMERQYGRLLQLPEEFKDNLKEARDELKQLRREAQEAPIVELEQDLSKRADEISETLEFYEDIGNEDDINRLREQAEYHVRVWKSSMRSALEEGDTDTAKLYNQYIKELEDSLDMPELETGDMDLEDVEIEDEIIPHEIDWTSFWKEQSLEAQYSFQDAFTVEGQMKALKDKWEAEQELIEPGDVVGGMKNWREYWQQVLELQERQDLFRMQRDATNLEDGVEDQETWDKRIQQVRKYYDKRREIAKREAEDEIEYKKRIAEIEKEEENEVTNIKEQETKTRKEIAGNYAGAAINLFQMVGQAAGKQSKRQFVIQKISSAARATMNTYEAITAALSSKDLPPGTRIPYAISVGAFGFSQVAKILSQSYDSARSTGRVSGGESVSYRGFDFEQNQRNDFAQSSPYQGSSSVSNQPSKGTQMPDSVETTITDGFDNMVARGTLELRKKNNEDLGLWK